MACGTVAVIGIPGGDDEADTYIGIMYGDGSDWPHFYSSAGECYRGFAELGAVWKSIAVRFLSIANCFLSDCLTPFVRAN